jgi:hypothetical protein
VKEKGQGRHGAPKSQEQTRGQGKSKESQALPNVWDALERKVRLHACWSPQFTHEEQEEYWRELREVGGSLIEIKTKGTALEKLLCNLYSSIVVQPGHGGPVIKHLSIEQFQQLRSNTKLH